LWANTQIWHNSFYKCLYKNEASNATYLCVCVCVCLGAYIKFIYLKYVKPHTVDAIPFQQTSSINTWLLIEPSLICGAQRFCDESGRARIFDTSDLVNESLGIMLTRAVIRFVSRSEDDDGQIHYWRHSVLCLRY
jgi:hypothetical protein